MFLLLVLVPLPVVNAVLLAMLDYNDEADEG